MVVAIPLTNSPLVALIDEGDLPLVDLNPWHLWTAPRPAHSPIRYARSNERKPQVLLHRVVMGEGPPGTHVDHIDGDGLNNTRVNLRFVTPSQNQARQRPQVGRSSIYKGVHFDKGKRRWRADIHAGGRRRRLGTYVTELDAAIAYNEAASEQWGEYARLNEVP